MYWGVVRVMSMVMSMERCQGRPNVSPLCASGLAYCSLVSYSLSDQNDWISSAKFEVYLVCYMCIWIVRC